MNKLSEKRQREILLQAKRETRRLKRKDRHYNPNRGPIQKSRFLTNPKVSRIRPQQESKFVVFPESLNFENDVEILVNLLGEIRQSIIYEGAKTVSLDQSELKSISLEAAVCICAEIQRCIAYKHRRRTVRSNYARSRLVNSTLSNLGFYKLLGIPDPAMSENETDVRYFEICTGNLVSARIADRLVTTFEELISFQPIARKRLMEAMSECMDNVFQWAYKEGDDDPSLYKQWWLAGMCDPQQNSVSFVFYDQGRGIPTTIRNTYATKNLPLVGKKDGQIIEEAVRTRISASKSSRRGFGLPWLKEFVKESPHGGELRLISNAGEIKYLSDNDVVVREWQKPLSGALITWKIVV